MFSLQFAGQEVSSYWYAAVRQYNFFKESDVLHANVNAGNVAYFILLKYPIKYVKRRVYIYLHSTLLYKGRPLKTINNIQKDLSLNSFKMVNSMFVMVVFFLNIHI